MSVLLVTFCTMVIRAQNSTAPAADVTIRMAEDESEYCLGEIFSPLRARRGPDDITLRLTPAVRYDNHRSETIIIPSWVSYLTRMTVAGQDGATVLRSMRSGGMDARTVTSLSRPDVRFTIIAPGRNAFSTALEVVLIPVVDHSTGLDLRGKTVQIVTTRDFRSLAPEVIATLNEKWKDYGTIWTGVSESETMTIQIPEQPLTRSCVTLVAR